MSDLPTYYTPEQVAAMFGLESTAYITDNATRWPHLRIARKLRFTQEHIDAIARLHEHMPAEPVASRQFGRRTRSGAA